MAATNNNGMLNLDTSASGYATDGGHTYDEAAFGYTSAWVGTATQATPAGPTTPAAMAATMQPLNVTDQSALGTAANELSSSATANNPSATTAVTPDTSNPDGVVFTGNAANAYTTPATDAFGYQEIGGNGAYNPYVAADGTNLSATTVNPYQGNGPSVCYGSLWQTVQTGWNWTIVGEQHAYRDATAT